MFVCAFPEFQDDARVLSALQLWKYHVSSSSFVCNLEQMQLCDNDCDLLDDAFDESVDHLLRLFAFATHQNRKMKPQFRRCIRKIHCNNFGIHHTLHRPGAQATSKYVDIGVLGIGVYPSASKLNHSCVPNALASFSGKEIIIRVVRPVSPGEQLYVSYGPLAANSLKAKRAEALSIYSFTCQCPGCQLDPSIHSYDRLYLCQQCQEFKYCIEEKSCRHCKAEIDWDAVSRKKEVAENFQQEQNWKMAIQTYKTIYHDRALPLGVCYDKLAQQYHESGQHERAVKYSLLSMQVVEYAYGRCSWEAAEELMKLVGLLMMAHQFKQAYVVIHECKDLYQKLGMNETRPLDIVELEGALVMINDIKLGGGL
ncbi:hypothetical protein DM01DRAFT_1336949 [Hesseltinella vesiculosa]|uniref:SET domain-containing protein n=1 Tax=Hesseltinella vesiculosa TaxID=101127 RepID=A0A1X2GEJ8_9FUNG|nr:hypothetical protein DM01DRAFT_1336949 [Hesseltinella vesiculosa]